MTETIFLAAVAVLAVANIAVRILVVTKDMPRLPQES